MRTRAPANETAVPAEAQLYERDFGLWVEAQAAAIRAGNLGALDVENVVEELEGLTKRDDRALGSQLKRIMADLLKQRHQPERATRSWEDSIANGREEIVDILDQSPSLRRTLPALMTRMDPRGLGQAARVTRLPVDAFPDQRPLTLVEVLGEEPGRIRAGARDTIAAPYRGSFATARRQPGSEAAINRRANCHDRGYRAFYATYGCCRADSGSL